MSYPSIKHINPATLTGDQQEEALWRAFQTDLPLGMAVVTADAQEVKLTGKRKLTPEDPNSPLGKQLIRLLGTDIARGILEKRLGVAFALYNCCGRVVAVDKTALQLSMAEQIMLQNGTLATADC